MKTTTPSKPKRVRVPKTPKPDRVQDIVSLLLALEDVLVGSAPSDKWPDIKHLYAKLKEPHA